MKYLFLCGAFVSFAVASAAGEVLHYTINWPSGLSLGEATLRADHTGEGTATPSGWEFDLDLDAIAAVQPPRGYGRD